MNDHKADAEEALLAAKLAKTGSDVEASRQMHALVSATLYMAEQQRIANLIALSSDDDLNDPLKGTWQSGFWELARQEIVKGLGL